MRLFTAIDLSSEVVENLDELLGRLRPTARIKWSRLANLHITTKFIGDWPEERLDELAGALGSVPKPGAIPVSVRGLGWFPNPRAPRVFWAGIEAGDGLLRLARDTDGRTRELGIPAERKRYSPHLTLARVKGPADLSVLRGAIEAIEPAEFGSFTAEKFFLYQSELRPEGSSYTKLAGFPLGG